MVLTIDQCLKQLALHGVDLTVEEFCDAAWLAARGFSHGQARDLHAPEISAESASASLPATPKTEDSASPKPAGPRAADSPKTPATEDGQPLHALGGSGSATMRGHALSLPAAPALSCGVDMDRALRPVRQRRPLPQQATVIDEEATVAAIAETGLWHIVRRPARGRWLDIEIVVEQSPTMRLWQDTALEFRQLLVRACAPRSIRSYFLSWTREEGLHLRTSGGRPVSLQHPTEGGGQKVILVLSDAMSFGWLNGLVPEQMARWAARCPTTLVQPLPVSLWKRSALRQVKVTSLNQPRPPSRKEGEDTWPPVTLATLDPASMRACSRLLAGAGSDGVICYRGSRSQFRVADQPPPRLARPFNPRWVNPEDVENLFRRFEEFSSEGARKLARHLAAAPLLLPVMRLIQRVLVPDPAPAQLAEIFLSGILYKVSKDGGENPAQTEYDFLPGIRERLLDLGGLDSAEKTIRLLSRYFEQRLGQGGFFTALLQDPNAAEGEWKVAGADGQARSFARLEKLLLDRMGVAEPAARTVASEKPPASKSGSGTKFIERNRAPRVYISYELDINGEPRAVELPFVVGVLADLSGKRIEERPLPDVGDRRFLEIDIDNFDDLMKSIRPTLNLVVANNVPTLHLQQLTIMLTFECMEDFSPEAVVKQIEPLRALLADRTEINNLLSRIDGHHEAEAALQKVLMDSELFPKGYPSPRLTEAENAAARKAASDLARLMGYQTTSANRPSRLELPAVQTLVRQMRQRRIAADVDALTGIQQVIVAIDADLSRQLLAIMHHPEFLRLEGAWRGLRHLVFNTETSTDLKIQVLNISKQEVFQTLKDFKGTGWNQSPLFKYIYEWEFSVPGGQPYGCLIGDFEFDHSPPDVLILSEMARIAAAAHAPFIAAAAPAVMNIQSWQELGDRRDLGKIFESAEYAAWRSLRDSEDSRYIGLTLPRFLARLPYSARNNPVEAFNFEEDAGSLDHSNFVWANAAYAMGVNIMRAFKKTGWCAQIRGVESGGIVDNLPVHTFPTDDGGVDMKCPTEIAITDRREHELSRLGFMPLAHWKNTDYAAFIGAQSLQKPARFEDEDATANANLLARFPYLFPCCRFAHYLKCIVRDKIGSFKERDDMEMWLNRWIQQYVTDSSAGDEIKAQKPLAAAEISLHDDPVDPYHYRTEFRLRPHHHLEGVNVSLQIKSRLPSERRE